MDCIGRFYALKGWTILVVAQSHSVMDHTDFKQLIGAIRMLFTIAIF